MARIYTSAPAKASEYALSAESLARLERVEKRAALRDEQRQANAGVKPAGHLFRVNRTEYAFTLSKGSAYKNAASLERQERERLARDAKGYEKSLESARQEQTRINLSLCRRDANGRKVVPFYPPEWNTYAR